MGDANIQIMYNERRNAFSIEKYYDDETLHNELAQTKFIPINMENPQENVNAILFILKSPDFMGQGQTVTDENRLNSPNTPNTPNDTEKMNNLF
jgi:hypothetical protein